MALGFSIPGDIKNEYMPFRLSPGKEPQTFSFRNKAKSVSSNFAQLNICPASLRDPAFGSYFGKDIGNKLVYGSKAADENSNAEFTLDDIFNNIPAIQIREFLPDTKLDQCVNFFGNLVAQITSKGLGGKSVKEVFKAVTGLNAKQSTGPSVTGWLKDKMYMMSILIEVIFKWLTEELPTMKFIGVDEAGSADGSADGKILQFPYLLYYKLQTCTTTNYYELPCNMNDKTLLWSDGTAGWLKGGRVDLATGTDKIGGLMGKALKFLTGSVFDNIRVNFMPYWSAEDGTANSGTDKVTISFDLFNDTEASAIANFIFVNTIVPGNRWLQYGMFQHSSNLYDIKLEGVNRLFACAGSFSVKYSGQLRTPPKSLLDKLNNKYGNRQSENRIKIPDVYHVEMSFTSLLPSNFNTYIYQYSTTNNIENCLTGELHSEGAYQTLSDKIKSGVDEIGELLES